MVFFGGADIEIREKSKNRVTNTYIKKKFPIFLDRFFQKKYPYKIVYYSLYNKIHGVFL